MEISTTGKRLNDRTKEMGVDQYIGAEKDGPT